MSNWTQAERRVAIDSPLGDDVLLLKSFDLTEEIGRPFICEVQLTSEDPEIDLNALIGEQVTIRLQRGDGETRFINGFVSRISQGGKDGPASMHEYSATIVPWLWFLTRSADCRIFQNKTIPEILKEVFDEFVFAESFEDKLTDTYQPHEFVVQYRETAFNFVSRLMEQEGIYYYFVHEQGRHKMLLADSPSAHERIAGYEELSCQGEGASDKHSVNEWTIERRVVPGRHALTDFDFKVPTKAMISNRSSERRHAASNYEVFDYPGMYTDKPEGDVLASVRIQEVGLCHEVVTARTDARGLSVGCKFKLEGSVRADQDREYVIVSMACKVREESYDTQAGGSTEEFFSATFKAVEAGTQIRIERATLKPLINGPQTAIVTGSPGDEITTDEFGRVKVRFHWDRWSEADDKSSCWIRVSQGWAGKKWGEIHTPRVGQEVIVEFLDGDPDRPIITGRVYNGDMMPPFDLPKQKNVSGIKSNSTKGGGGYNEISLDDSKGCEKITIHGQFDMNTTVEHDMSDTVHNNRTITVDGTHTETINKDTKVTITTGTFHHDVVDNTATYHVMKDVTETYEATQTTTVTQEVKIESLKASIEAAAKKEIVLHTGSTTSVDMLEAGQINIAATDSITLSVGPCVIQLSKDGTIKISATKIEVTGGQETKIGVGNQQMTCNLQKVNVSGAAINSSAVGMHEIAGAVVKVN